MAIGIMYSAQNFVILMQPILIAFLQGAMNSKDAVKKQKKKKILKNI